MDILPTEEQAKEIAITAAAIGTGLLLKKGLEQGYRKVYGEEPPNAITDREVEWPKVLGWAFLTGTLIYGVRVGIKRWGGKQLAGR
jgi:hypothetical protein